MTTAVAADLTAWFPRELLPEVIAHPLCTPYIRACAEAALDLHAEMDAADALPTTLREAAKAGATAAIMARYPADIALALSTGEITADTPEWAMISPLRDLPVEQHVDVRFDGFGGTHYISADGYSPGFEVKYDGPCAHAALGLLMLNPLIASDTWLDSEWGPWRYRDIGRDPLVARLMDLALPAALVTGYGPGNPAAAPYLAHLRGRWELAWADIARYLPEWWTPHYIRKSLRAAGVPDPLGRGA